jgi:hypothetical protein
MADDRPTENLLKLTKEIYILIYIEPICPFNKTYNLKIHQNHSLKTNFI